MLKANPACSRGDFPPRLALACAISSSILIRVDSGARYLHALNSKMDAFGAQSSGVTMGSSPCYHATNDITLVKEQGSSPYNNDQNSPRQEMFEQADALFNEIQAAGEGETLVWLISQSCRNVMTCCIYLIGSAEALFNIAPYTAAALLGSER